MAEAAAAGAAPHDLHADPFLDHFNIWDEEAGEGWGQLGVDPLQHGQRGIGVGGPHLGNCAIGVIVHLIERGDVNPRDGRQGGQQFTFALTGRLPGLIGVNDIEKDLFPFADRKGIHERRNRLGIVDRLAAGDDQWLGLVPLSTAKGQVSQVEYVEEVGIKRFVGQADADDVEIGQGALAFQTVERDVILRKALSISSQG